MSLAYGREFLSIPGPGVIPDAVLQAMHRPATDIYEGGELEETTWSLLRDLKPVARTEGEPFIFIANGHGAWEAALANTLSRGDRILVLESGRFAVGWGLMAQSMGIEMEILHAPPRRAIDVNAVEDRLREDTGHSIKAILCVQVDTASSLYNDIAAIRQAIDAAGHPALFMVDVIASQGCMRFEMDEWGVDVTVGGSQKGLMCPPGLGFNWASEKALEVHQTAGLRTQYWDWSLKRERPHYRKYCGTAPIHHIYALRAALDILLGEGLENAWKRHRAHADGVRAAVSAWAADGPLEMNAIEPAERADSVTTILTPGLDVEKFRRFCHKELGLVLGLGIGDFDGKAFRIGHMGHLSPPMILGTLAAAQVGLIASQIPHGAGAIESATAAIAEHF